MKQNLPLILMVEDDIDHKVLVMRHMRYTKKNIDHVADGQAALDYLFRRGKFSEMTKFPLPDLILLDLRLPKIDGLEVLRQIKASNTLKHIPVVILSSSKNPNDVQAADKNGAEDFLVKALSSPDFSDQIELLVKFWLEKKEIKRTGQGSTSIN